MKNLRMLVLFFIIFCFSGVAQAYMFSFYGESQGGAGSANMDISITGNTLILTLDNTSPITLLDGTGVNIPSITGFGFNVDPATIAWVSWDLKAYTSNGTVVTLGSNSAGSWEWIMDTTIANITLDYMATSGSNLPQGSLYNPAATPTLDAYFAKDPFFTTAVLTMNFNEAPQLLINTNSESPSPFVRMQQVGEDQEGSLKLNPNPIPQPISMLLFGTGLVGVGGYVRRKLKK